jgi:hypothetical protein
VIGSRDFDARAVWLAAQKSGNWASDGVAAGPISIFVLTSYKLKFKHFSNEFSQRKSSKLMGQNLHSSSSNLKVRKISFQFKFVFFLREPTAQCPICTISLKNYFKLIISLFKNVHQPGPSTRSRKERAYQQNHPIIQ